MKRPAYTFCTNNLTPAVSKNFSYNQLKLNFLKWLRRKTNMRLKTTNVMNPLMYIIPNIFNNRNS